MSVKSAAFSIVVVAAVSWGCAAPSTTPVAESAAETEVGAGTAVAEAGVETETTAVAPTPVTGRPSTAAVSVAPPQLGLGIAAAAAPTEAEIPARVAAFIDQIAKHQRGRFTGRWVTAQDARVHPEVVIPALIVALQHDQTRTKARQLLVEVGPAAAPHVQKEVDRMKTELATDPTLERTIQVVEQLMRGWR